MAKKISAEKVMKDWNTLSFKFRHLGAQDTEPDFHFQRAIQHALHGQLLIPESANSWELYSSKAGSSAAARQLTAFTKKVAQAILKVPVSQIQALCEDFANHLSRVDPFTTFKY